MAKQTVKQRKAQPAPVDAGDLKRFADRLDSLEEERVGIVGDIKDVFTEVKSKGYNAKALRKVLADRRKKTDEELEADMEMYRAALAEPGATYRSVAERHGIPKTNLHRLVPKSSRGTGGGQPDSDLGAAAGDETVAPATPAPKPEDGDDGITESCGGVESRHAARQGGDAEALPPLGADSSRPGKAQSLPSVRRAQGDYPTALSAGVAPGPHDTSDEAPAPRSVGAVAAEPRVAPPFLGDDPGPIPPFLRGSRTAQGRV